MAKNRVIFDEWRDANSSTKFPFSETATLVNSAGEFIPNDLFIDARLYPVGGSGRQFLSKVVVTNSKVTLTVSDSLNDLAEAEFSIESPPEILNFTDFYGRPAGIAVTNTNMLYLLPGWGVGEHRFRVNETEFCSTVVIPVPDTGVLGFLLDDGTVYSSDVLLCGCDGVVLTTDEEGKIVYNVVGDPMFVRKIAEEEGVFDTPVFLKTINGEGPDPYGDFHLFIGTGSVPDPVLRMTRTSGGVRLWAVGAWI